MKPDKKLARQLRRSIRSLDGAQRRFRLRRPVLLAIVPIALVGGVALAKTVVAPTTTFIGPRLEPKSPAAARHLALEEQVLVFVNKAVKHVQGTVPACRPSHAAMRLGTTPTHAAPSRAVLDVLAPLRRPATAADRAMDRPERLGIGGRQSVTYVDYVRRVTATDGSRYTILVEHGARPIFAPTPRAWTPSTPACSCCCAASRTSYARTRSTSSG